MEIEYLRTIGRRLLAMIPRHRFAPGSGVALRVGASGDRTFPLDKEAEETILSSLEELGVPFHVVSEEMGVREGGPGALRVIIDPIDGSRNAVSGLPVFCSSIAIADGERIGDVFMSYVVNLVSGDEFWAEKGKGAFMNAARIRPQDGRELKVILYEAQKPGRDIPRIMHLLGMFTRARCLGATALDLCYLAMGAASAFAAPAPSRSFDFAGGWLIAREAGALVTDFRGGGLDGVALGLGYSVPLLASANKDIHERLISAMREQGGVGD